MEPLWAELLNSDWHDHRGSGAREDRIGNDAWLLGFLGKAGWSQTELPDDRDRAALRQMRELLRRVIDTYRLEGTLAPETLGAMNRMLEAAPVVRQLDAGASLRLVPLAGGIAQLQAEIIVDLATMLAAGEPERVKLCANPDCGWVIYDESRNRARRWCSASACGNLLNVRKHRRSKRRVS